MQHLRKSQACLIARCRILGEMGAINHTAKYVRNQRLKHPDAEPLMMLLGHCYASQVRRA